ncbi:MAG: ABC transporter permease [Acholeplasmatales bacterium]|nr:ABC transporter permease [Acholeplasmatales bacterium]
MLKYVIKRVLLMFFSLFVITTICFFMVRLLPRELPIEKGTEEIVKARYEMLGYNKPIIVQYFYYLKNIFTGFDFGTSWYIQYNTPVTEVFGDRFLPTVLVNVYSLLFSIPVGIALGIYAAIKKNKWQDQVVNVIIILFVSIPSYVYAFLVQYIFYFKLGWFPAVVHPLANAGGTYFSWAMFHSMIPAILSLSFGEIAGLCRFVRAELTETLTSDYMLLARTKGLTRSQATVRHALKNAMVPTLPMIIGSLFSILGGSLIIEQIFSIPGVGVLYLQSVQQLDYDVFMFDSIFYTLIGLTGGIVVDLSYGFIDPRIRMGAR